MNRTLQNAKAVGIGPFTCKMEIAPWSKKLKAAVLDRFGWHTDYMSLNGNSKQRRQQRRKLIRELNQ